MITCTITMPVYNIIIIAEFVIINFGAHRLGLGLQLGHPLSVLLFFNVTDLATSGSSKMWVTRAKSRQSGGRTETGGPGKLFWCLW